MMIEVDTEVDQEVRLETVTEEGISEMNWMIMIIKEDDLIEVDQEEEGMKMKERPEGEVPVQAIEEEENIVIPALEKDILVENHRIPEIVDDMIEFRNT